MGEKSLQQMVLRQLDIRMQKNESELCPHIVHKDNSHWVIDLNLRAKARKLLEGNLGIHM